MVNAKGMIASGNPVAVFIFYPVASLVLLFHGVGSIKYSHSKATIGGGVIIQTGSGLDAVRRRQVAHPSRHPLPSPSSAHSPSQRAISFGSVCFIFVLC
jgi:hypothetical protein